MIKLETKEQLEQLIQNKCILLFSAKWCPDCRVIEHFLPEVEEKYPDYQLVYVDRDQFIDVCVEHDIYGIPSFIVYNNKEVKGSFISKLRKTKQEIFGFLDSVV